MKLVDVRSREEFEAVNIAGSVLLSQDVMRELMASGSNTNPIVVIDHAGKNGLDAAAYFMGHGLQNVRCLRGGIDAWAQEVEPTMRQIQIGLKICHRAAETPRKNKNSVPRRLCGSKSFTR